MRRRDTLVLLGIIAVCVAAYRVIAPVPKQQVASTAPTVASPVKFDAQDTYSDAIQATSTTFIDEGKINSQKVEQEKQEIANAFPDVVRLATSTGQVIGSTAKQVKILPTPTGFLNVRSLPSRNGQIVAKVKPGETYSYTEEKNGWYRIELQGQNEAWILGTYAKPL